MPKNNTDYTGSEEPFTTRIVLLSVESRALLEVSEELGSQQEHISWVDDREDTNYRSDEHVLGEPSVNLN